MIKPSRKQNPTDGSAHAEAEEGRACGGEAGALMGQGSKILAGSGAEPLEREDSSARAGRSVPTIPPVEKPLTWLFATHYRSPTNWRESSTPAASLAMASPLSWA